MEKCQFFSFLHRRFRCSESLVCYIKRQKSFFLDLFSGSLTLEYRGYRGLQGVTGGDKGLHGVTKGYRGYKGLPAVTNGYRGLQGVKRGYRWLQRIIETFF